MARDRAKAERHGHLAEWIALSLLRLKGYRLLAWRFKHPLGEIDLVMRRGAVTAFIEVKARPSRALGLEAVGERQARRIAAAARGWMARDAKAMQGICRFDIVVVSPYQWPQHIENAFFGDSQG
jgi:putative endonuclease